MFFEQYSHEPYIAVSRYVLQHLELDDERRALLASKREGGLRALQVMEDHLRGQDFFVAGRYSIADVALYAYTHVADEGGFAMDDYPAIRSWLERVRSQPGHIPIAQA
jgi:glutathione S-transferase